MDSKGLSIEIEDQCFASGGEGAVYNILSKNSKYKDCCVKIFKNDKIKARYQKLEYMIRHPLMAPPDSNYRICWPVDFVYRETTVVGFIMPLAFANSDSLYKLYLNDNCQVYDRRTIYGVVNRLKLLYNIVNILFMLHKRGYVVVDFKPQNLLFSQSGKISLIDLDSIQISEGSDMLFPASAFTLDYAYPKELENIYSKIPCSEAWDSYSFAIVAYQILFGIHPFVSTISARMENGQEFTDKVDAMKYNLYPLGVNNHYIEIIPPPHYYLYLIPRDLKEVFLKAFDISTEGVKTIDWLSVLYNSITKNDEIQVNPFRCTPSKPVFILTSSLPVSSKAGDNLLIEWYTYEVNTLYINNKKYDPQSKRAKIIIPDNLIINIECVNNNGSTVEKIVLKTETLYCVNCGNRFIFNNEYYCSNCGLKKFL